MRVALKAMWTVHAGVLPEQSDAKLMRKWYYSSSDFQEDVQNARRGAATIFAAKMKEAHDYAASVTNPSYVNWVRIDFIWV